MSYRGQGARIQIGDGATATPTVVYDPATGSMSVTPKTTYSAPDTHATSRGAPTRARSAMMRSFDFAFNIHMLYEVPAILKAALGSVSSSGMSAPYTHTFRAPVGGTPAPISVEYDYGDDFANSRIAQTARVKTATISIPTNDYVTLAVTGTALAYTAEATKTALSESTPRTDIHANDCTTLTLNSVNLLSGGLAQSLTINIDNNVEPKYGIGSLNPAASFNSGKRAVTADLVVHIDVATYDDYRTLHESGDEVTLVATLTSGSTTITFTLRGAIVSEPAEPTAQSNGLIAVTVKLEGRQTTSADMFDVVVVNANADAFAN